MFQEIELCDSKIEKFLTFSQKKAFLIFWEMELFKKASYILGNGTFQAQKIKKYCCEKISYISGNGTLQCQA